MGGWPKVFKTYVRGRSAGSGKRPADKVKGRDHISTFEEVEGFDCFGGILQTDVIDISFDTKELYQAFLELARANAWRTLALPSSKGGHTYWRTSRYLKNGQDRRLAVGLIADIHSGSTYIPLKVHGECRYPPDYGDEDTDLQELPEELLPVSTTVKLWQMTDGEGRNQEIFRYIQRLQSAYALTQETIIRILTNANRFVLADPLPDAELDVILRDESFAKPVFYNGKTFLHDEFGEYLMKQYHIVRMNDQLHIYKDGAYVPGYFDIERSMLEEIRGLRKTQRREVLDYIQLRCREVAMAPAKYIAFRNGILDITSEDGQLLPFSEDLYVTNQIPWDYRPDAYHEDADKMLDRVACNDKGVRALLEECIGYCFFRRNELRKAFILTGGKRGGKSTYLDCIKGVLGDYNVSALDLREVGDRFSTAMMFGKLANIGDDIGDDFLMGSQVAIFKKVVAGNRIKAERKGLEPFDFDPYVKLLFSANEIPRMRDRGNAVLDRLIIIPFNAVFDKTQPDYDPWLKYKLQEQEAMEYFVRIGVEGLHRILSGEGFTETEAVTKRMKEYEEENNPILAFIREVDAEQEILNEPTADVYRKYSVFCQENGLNPVGKIVFSRNLCDMIGCRSVPIKTGGQLKKVYMK